jgi:hypothetical protein
MRRNQAGLPARKFGNSLTPRLCFHWMRMRPGKWASTAHRDTGMIGISIPAGRRMYRVLSRVLSRSARLLPMAPNTVARMLMLR